MSARRKRRATMKTGLAPGSLIYTGEARAGHGTVHVVAYDEQREEVREGFDPAMLVDGPGVRWVDVDAIHDVELVRTIGEAAGLHPLAMEDMLNPDTRAKCEDYGNILFLVIKMLTRSSTAESPLAIDSEQVSLALGKGWLVTFQENPGDLFDPVRRRVRTEGTRIRKHGADHLVHALLDAIVDGYFPILEAFEEQIDLLQLSAIDSEQRDLPQRVHAVRTELVQLRRHLWGTREAVKDLAREDNPHLDPSVRPYLRDLQDHLNLAMDTADTANARLTSTVDLHLAAMSQRMNETMQVFTVASTIFIPLTFIVGVYGMNFDVMPELHQAWAYPAVWALMALISVGLLIFFRRRRFI